jgi:hypothetical protein
MSVCIGSLLKKKSMGKAGKKKATGRAKTAAALIGGRKDARRNVRAGSANLYASCHKYRIPFYKGLCKEKVHRAADAVLAIG